MTLRSETVNVALALDTEHPMCIWGFVMGRHTSKEVQKGGPSYLMTSNPYTKPHATAEERVAHLQAKGLVIASPEIAAQEIEQIGYERLRIYFLSRRDLSRPGKPFESGTTYKNILRLYECDVELRNVCLSAVGRFELLLRNRISEVLSGRLGSHPYFKTSAFANAEKHNEALQKILQVFTSSKDERAKHYRRTYTEPPLPPIWMLKEFLTFGASARFYGALANPIREEIAKAFKVPSLSVFDSWVPGFVDLRNICAHHDRLFNRRFQKQPERFRRANVPLANPTTLKAQLECLDYVLRADGATSDLVEKVRRTINRFPEIRSDEVGY